jgi:hypothetical protein
MVTNPVQSDVGMIRRSLWWGELQAKPESKSAPAQKKAFQQNLQLNEHVKSAQSMQTHQAERMTGCRQDVEHLACEHPQQIARRHQLEPPQGALLPQVDAFVQFLRDFLHEPSVSP